MTNKGDKSNTAIRGTVVRMLGGAVLMFGFGFALVPIYDLMCDITGINGRTAGQYEYDTAHLEQDESRLIRVNFITSTNAGMTWIFEPTVRSVWVHPGSPKTVTFTVTNPTDQVMVGQAVPSVSPTRANNSFHKTECFCFDKQVLQPGETMEMPMRFIVDTDLPKSVKSISLSYALFDVTEGFSGDLSKSAPQSDRI